METTPLVILTFADSNIFLVAPLWRATQAGWGSFDRKLGGGGCRLPSWWSCCWLLTGRWFGNGCSGNVTNAWYSRFGNTWEAKKSAWHYKNNNKKSCRQVWHHPRVKTSFYEDVMLQLTFGYSKIFSVYLLNLNFLLLPIGAVQTQTHSEEGCFSDFKLFKSSSVLLWL